MEVRDWLEGRQEGHGYYIRTWGDFKHGEQEKLLK